MNFSRRRFLRCAALGAATIICPAPRSSVRAAQRERPNFLFILADDLGWTDVGCFGSTFYETPNIDKLAADGMKFTNAYAACPVCSPTRASIMTGKYPARMDTTDYFGAPQPDVASLHANQKKLLGDKPLLPAKYEAQMALADISHMDARDHHGPGIEHCRDTH